MKLSKEAIERQMAKSGLIQGDLATRIGCSRSTLSEALRSISAGNDVRPRTAGQLAAALGVELDVILATSPSEMQKAEPLPKSSKPRRAAKAQPAKAGAKGVRR